MVVYVVFVAIILQASTPDYPLFILSAILPWKWFTTIVGDGVSSVTSMERLIKQIQFPKIVLPVAATTAGVVGFGFGLIALVVIMLFFPHRISINLLFIPLIAAVQYVFTLGMALAVASEADAIIAYLSSPIPNRPDPPCRVGPCRSCGAEDCFATASPWSAPLIYRDGEAYVSGGFCCAHRIGWSAIDGCAHPMIEKSLSSES